MAARRLIVFPLVMSVATACIPAVNPDALAPQRGPQARVYASYTGGITARNAQARFTVGSDAYVLVGHLGGDGYIRILYPSNPRERGSVRKGETYSTASVYAPHDAIPSLYNARTVRYRHVSARMDSYDGAGNGYFFIVASRWPLAFDEISQGSMFDDIEVPDYFDTYDPRLTIRALADLVSRGSPYTLDFASSFGSINYTNAFDERLDCMTLSMFNFGVSSYYAMSPYFVFGSRAMRNSLGCANQYASMPRFGNTYYSYVPAAVTPPPRAKPDGTIRPPWQRRVTPRPRAGVTAASRSYLPERINARRSTSGYSPRSPRSISEIHRGVDSWSSDGARASAPARQAESAAAERSRSNESPRGNEGATRAAPAPREKKDP